MKRKQVKSILAGLGIVNRFSLKTVTFLGRDRLQMLTVRDWEPNPKAGLIQETFRPHNIIVDFE